MVAGSKDVKLLADIDAVVRGELARVGLDGLDRPGLYARFRDRASRASIYRHLSRSIAAGGRAVIEMEADGPAAQESIPGGHLAPIGSDGELLSAVVPASESSAAPAERGIAILASLEQCMIAAQQVMSYSRTEDGRVRNAKLLLASSEHLRRALETAVRLRESMRQDRDLDRFLDEVVAEVEKESPPTAQRLLQRLSDLLTLRGA